MPIIDEIEEEFQSLGSGVERSSNGVIHLTDVITCIEKELGREYTGSFGDSPALVMDFGFTFERALELAFKDRLGVRLGEVELDGIVGSPDAICFDPYSDLPALGEWKLTWKSSKTTPDTNWRYMTQVQSYLKMLDLDVVVMRILHINGDYKGSGPQYKVYRIAFDQSELEDNWNMILTHAEELR